MPAVTPNPADSISFANRLASISVGNAFVRLADGARGDVGRHCCGGSTETYQRFLMARIDPSPARWKHGDVVKRLLICRCNFYDNGDGRALMWVIPTSSAFDVASGSCVPDRDRSVRISAKSWAWAQVVPRKGLEPSRPLSHWHLKPARLPIPPPGPGPVSTDRSRACQIGKV